MKKIYPYIIVLCTLLAACRGDLPLMYSEGEVVDPEPSLCEEIKGMYLLNEGNMGSNKCTLDYYDCTRGTYHRNIYAERNPEIVKELGDVGNDIAVYGDYLFVVVNCSHMVEVMDARTARHIASLSIINCRYIAFCGDKAYVSSYAGPVQVDPLARPGKVVEINLKDMTLGREVTVGYQPEEMVVHEGKLYVANSGGYRFPNYDRTVSVVDIESLQVVNTIDVAINLHRMEIDRWGRIYVSSRGDYDGRESNIYVIDTATQKVSGRLDISASEMTMCGDSIYMVSTEWNNATSANTVGYAIYDVKRQKVVSRCFISDGTDKEIKLPYGVAVNPESKEIYVTDATNYVTPGYLYCFTPEGKKKWKVRTGDIPGHMAFTRKILR